MNEIEDITVVQNLVNLEDLNAMNNRIVFLPNFSKCDKLKRIDLRANRIVFNKNFYNLIHVTRLNLNDNMITEINWVSSLANLKYLNFDNNPVKCSEINNEIKEKITLGVIQFNCLE